MASAAPSGATGNSNFETVICGLDDSDREGVAHVFVGPGINAHRVLLR